ncbi:osmotic avoidance abnormal protein 3 isoform X2 [Dunckerocampus dactyliophorus]|uniref:osmotic avoidance abnormal protein 3 isoform X2 n=1 Tax=Dunckerocampus dactyliophorus TaxID=161453 RepID=UPI002405ED91|nr:osmotic avoidance abnormal protein 3 isoform X2 [Dunckerocampus dactyliophorus]
MASVGMEEAMLMRDGEEVKVGIVLNPISGGSESVFINEDGQNVDYVSKEEKLQSFSFDQAVTVDNMQELLQPLTESICEGHSGSLLLCGASMENISTLIDHVIVKQVLINVLSRVMSQVKREVFISVSFLQFDPDGNGVDLLSPESNSPELVLHPVLGIVISDLSEACVGSAEEAYTVYKTCREAQKANETLRCGSLLFTMTVEWKLHTGEADFQFCRSRLQLFNLVGGACRTDPKGVNPLLKVVQQIQSEAAKADLLLPLLVRDALTGNSRTALIYCIQPQGDVDGETLSALSLAQKVNHLSTKAAVCRWSPREAEQEIRGRITALRRVMMSEAGNETHDTRRLAELIKHLQIVKDQSWEKRRKESERIQLKLNGAQCQADRHLSDIEPRESSATVKRFQEELKQEMEAHIKEDRESAEKVQERLTKILQLREALRKNTEKNISAVKCDLCLQLEERHAHGRRRQVKELSGRLIQQEVEKMEKDLAREQLPSEGPQRELLVLSRERQVLVLQMEALRAEAQQAQKALQDQYDVHQSEMQHLTEESLQVFRRFHESSKDVRRMSEVRYRSVLLEAVQDAVYLSAQNQQLQADNKRLRQALGELKDTLTKRGPHAATVFPSKHD